MKSLALLTLLLGFTAITRASVTETFKQSYPLAADGVLQLENVNGDIEITAWDKAEVALEAVKRAKDEDALKLITLEIDAQPAKISIKTKYPKKGSRSFFGNDNSSVRYKLLVPAGVKLDKIASVNSDISVTGVNGSVKLDTVNGKIDATGLRADARLESVNGSLRAEFASVEQVKEVKLESVNGRAEVTLPKGASASIKTSTVNGNSSVDQPIRLSRTGKHNLSGEIGNGGPRISLETVNGSIAVREK